MNLRCCKCFDELRYTEYDCGIFIEQCDCDESEEAIREKIEKEYNVAEAGVYEDGYKDGYNKGLVGGFKNGVKDMKNRISNFVGRTP